MAGLALGSYLGGRWSDRKRGEGRPPAFFLKTYGVLELAIGLWALLTLGLLNGVEHLYLELARREVADFSLQTILFLSSFAVLLPPTTAMGATLPVFTQTLVLHRSETGGKLSTIYGLNTLGACLGAALGGLAFLPLLGLTKSLILTAFLNVLIAKAAYSGSESLPDNYRSAETQVRKHPLPEEPRAEANGEKNPWLPIVFGISGFTGMVYQIGWTRALILSIGSSTYSFSIILVTFLAALGLGSFIYRRLFSSRHPKIRDLARLQLLIGISAFLVTVGMGWLPMLKVLSKGLNINSFLQIAALDTVTVFLLILIPTLALGLTFPLVTHLYTSRVEDLGRSLGEAYSANTFGAIIGSFTTGFVLMPLLGLQDTIRLAVSLNLLGALCLFLAFGQAARRSMRVPDIAMLVFSLVLILVGPRWDLGIVSSGTGISYQGQKLRPPPIFYRDGVSSTVSVGLNSGIYPFLAVNGKTDASMTESDRQTQLLLGLIPAALHSAPKEIAVIGFGSGQTVVGLLSVPGVTEVRCAELEPAVLEAKKFFAPYSEGYLEDPRLTVVIEDGRRFILGSSKTFDIIVSEPSNPWIAGIGNLYTQDFYKKCRQQLKPGGIMAQWFHLYAVSERELQLVFRTFFSVFPEGGLYLTSRGDILLIGSEEDIRFQETRLLELYQHDSGAAFWLHLLGLGTPGMLRGTFLASREQVMDFLQRNTPPGSKAAMNTDDLPLLEFLAPLNLHRREQTLEPLTDSFPMMPSLDQQSSTAELQGAILGRLALSLPFDQGAELERLERLDPQARSWTPELLRPLLAPAEHTLDPMRIDALASSNQAWLRIALLDLLAQSGQYVGLSALYGRALENPPPGSEYKLALNAGRAAQAEGNLALAEDHFSRAAPLSSNPQALYLRGTLGPIENWNEDDLRAAVSSNPFNAIYRTALSQLLEQQQEFNEALEEALESYRLFPFQEDLLELLVRLYRYRQDPSRVLEFTDQLRNLRAIRLSLEDKIQE